MDKANSTIETQAKVNWRWRKIKDELMMRVVQVGGAAVIGAIALIFIFLLSVVYPLFEEPEIHESARYQLPSTALGHSLMLGVEEQAEIAFRVTKDGSVLFFDVSNGQSVINYKLPISDDDAVLGVRNVSKASRLLAANLKSGGLLFFKHEYDLEFTETERIIHPKVVYPFGQEVVDLGDSAITQFAIGENEDNLTIFYQNQDGELGLIGFEKLSSFISEDVVLEEIDSSFLNSSHEPVALLVDPEQEWAYVLNERGTLALYDIRDIASPDLQEVIDVTNKSSKPTSIEWLIGGISVLVGDDSGVVSQWFKIRAEGDVPYTLKKIREFKVDSSAINKMASEQLRKGVVAAAESGKVNFFYTTSERDLMTIAATEGEVQHIAIAPRSDILLLEDSLGQLSVWDMDNHHPESSLSGLWGKVWYEDYQKPDYIWQSSSASSDFEPKYSLIPLTFGTIKAAFYAMLFAMPLAICGAIFTAYFMRPKMRTLVKPSIEIMEALPTVILGFLAGLWLAPYIEQHLPGVVFVLIFVPLGIILSALIWWRLPFEIKSKIPEGWEAAILALPIITIVMLCMSASTAVEGALFEGNIRIWMSENLGVGFDQRNALIIGIAMGFAVIPTIFSIAEDAIFSVPKHLTSGSLALGATPWQTLVRVVLPSASPGIFSAVMIGFGRAVGETMIVLMATGNTPVMDFGIFEGMRTLSANVAVELPESEVDSTHYRILFLAAFVLFMFTFFFNTIAEIVRQRLRRKYATL